MIYKNITVYTRDDCIWCMRAKELLTKHSIPFQTIHMPSEITRDELLETFPTARTMPIIVVDGEYIGGFEQLQKRILDELLPRHPEIEN